jgi:tetratricopeptide (TPR) repeat protein
VLCPVLRARPEAVPGNGPQPHLLTQEVDVASTKAQISENVQGYVAKSDWKSALAELEKLFALDQDPQVKVRMGDIWQKMYQKQEAISEYLRAAEVFAERGFVVKALAMYKLVLRLDPAHTKALDLISGLHANKSVAGTKVEPPEAGAPETGNSVIPLFADLSPEDFADFTKCMVFHTFPAGKAIIREGATGASVFIVTRGSVRVSTTIDGKKIELAVLRSGDFFGEIAFLTGKPRTATVETVEESDILEVTEDDLKNLVAQKPHMKEIMQNYYEQRVASTLQKVREVN